MGYPVARAEWVVVRSETIRPAYIIGADGCDSAVRRMAGIEMAEHRAAQVFSIYEIEAAGELPTEARVIFDPDLTVSTGPSSRDAAGGAQIRPPLNTRPRWGGSSS